MRVGGPCLKVREEVSLFKNARSSCVLNLFQLLIGLSSPTSTDFLTTGLNF